VRNGRSSGSFSARCSDWLPGVSTRVPGATRTTCRAYGDAGTPACTTVRGCRVEEAGHIGQAIRPAPMPPKECR
jgi:hypothetical protein